MDCHQMTQIPWLDKVVRKNPVADSVQRIFRRTASLSILGFVAKAIEEKRAKLSRGEDKSCKAGTNERKDFLTRFIEVQEKNAEIPAW